MRELAFESIDDARLKRSPNDPGEYVYHDDKVTQFYRDGPLKSIEKEIEGMARLVVAADGELGPDTVQELLELLREERSRLRELEHGIQDIR